jgi:hypothetical protein
VFANEEESIYGRSPALSGGHSNVGYAQVPAIEIQARSGSSATAVVGPSRRQRLVWVPQLTMVDRSGRTAALTVAERQCTTHKGPPVFSIADAR